MKKLFDYMIESEKQFVYRIKVAGEFPKEQYNKYTRRSIWLPGLT